MVIVLSELSVRFNTSVCCPAVMPLNTPIPRPFLRRPEILLAFNNGTDEGIYTYSSAVKNSRFGK